MGRLRRLKASSLATCDTDFTAGCHGVVACFSKGVEEKILKCGRSSIYLAKNIKASYRY